MPFCGDMLVNWLQPPVAFSRILSASLTGTSNNLELFKEPRQGRTMLLNALGCFAASGGGSSHNLIGHMSLVLRALGLTEKKIIL